MGPVHLSCIYMQLTFVCLRIRAYMYLWFSAKFLIAFILLPSPYVSFVWFEYVKKTPLHYKYIAGVAQNYLTLSKVTFTLVVVWRPLEEQQLIGGVRLYRWWCCSTHLPRETIHIIQVETWFGFGRLLGFPNSLTVLYLHMITGHWLKYCHFSVLELQNFNRRLCKYKHYHIQNNNLTKWAK